MEKQPLPLSELYKKNYRFPHFFFFFFISFQAGRFGFIQLLIYIGSTLSYYALVRHTPLWWQALWTEVCVCVRALLFSPDHHPDRLADRNQLLLSGGGTQLLREEGGVDPGQAEGDGIFNDMLGLRIDGVSNRSSAGTVAVRPPCVLRGRGKHLAGKEIAEEEFAGQQSAKCSSTKGNHAAVPVLPQDVQPVFPSLTSPLCARWRWTSIVQVSDLKKMMEDESSWGF